MGSRFTEQHRKLVNNADGADLTAMKKRESNRKRESSDVLSTNGKVGKKVVKMPKRKAVIVAVFADYSSIASE